MTIGGVDGEGVGLSELCDRVGHYCDVRTVAFESSVEDEDDSVAFGDETGSVAVETHAEGAAGSPSSGRLVKRA